MDSNKVEGSGIFCFIRKLLSVRNKIDKYGERKGQYKSQNNHGKLQYYLESSYLFIYYATLLYHFIPDCCSW